MIDRDLHIQIRASVDPAWRQTLAQFESLRLAHRRAERRRRVVRVLRDFLGIALLAAIGAALWHWVVTAA